MLADDSVTAQNMGRKILADAGYEVITVNNGSAALKKVADARPDLIVLDVYMPGYSGLEVCQRLKESSDTARIPILLTVGKLEPFKPEEAKRVRAEGFIVKPFEASELLSALTKLEDKMVPRTDSSKPGRFARAIAAVEEGRYDNTVAIDEDTGWKNRIAFPSKKKKASEPEDGDDPAIYNPVNKDLKTTVDHSPVQAPQPAKVEEKLDVTALAPEGLPKDVTAEEIAALAAAAAQVKGIIDGAEQAPISATPQPDADARSETVAHKEASPERSEVSEPKLEATGVPAVADTAENGAGASEGATFAAQKPQEEQAEQKAIQAETQVQSIPDIPAETLPAVAALHETSMQLPEMQVEAEPVTMARPATEPDRPQRWMAVAATLAPEEVGLVLEEEMRKAYAAFVGADSRAAETVSQISEVEQPVAAVAVSEEPVSSGSPADPEPAVIEGSSSLESSPTTPIAPDIEEPTAAKVKDFETVQVSAARAPLEVSPEPEPSAPVEPSVAPVVEEVAVAPEPTPAEPVAPEIFQPIAEAPPVAIEAAATSTAELGNGEPKPETAPVEPQPEMAAVAAVPIPEASAVGAEELKALELPAPAAVAVDESPATSIAAEAAPVTESTELVSGGQSREKNQESDIAATTAAAWASWRRIRESGDTKTPEPPVASAPMVQTEEPGSEDKAAMAVAAGAERAPEDVSDSSEISPEIASIVDNVLADIRPKIVEEISRKLGKKK